MDFKIKLLTVGGKKLKLTIWDTGKLWQWSVLSLFNASNLKYRSYLSTCKEPWKLNYTIKRFSTFLSFFPLLFCTFATTSPCVLGFLSCKRRIHQIRNQNQENFFVELSSPRTGSLHLIWLLYWRSVSFILNLECYYLYFWYKSLLFPIFPC